MRSSLDDFSRLQTPHVSSKFNLLYLTSSLSEAASLVADLIAMGTIFAYASCGGPNHASIPFRGGRVDAKSAGPPGVPEPQQDLQSHTDSFRRQGFNQSEMIALVACGHTVGGVRKDDFPTIVDRAFALFNGDGQPRYTKNV